MNHKNSDIDIGTVYLMDSKDFLLRKKIKGKQIQDKLNNTDSVFYELSHVINNLLKMNCNFLWMLTSPLIVHEHRTTLKELRDIVSTNLAKCSYFSIDGLSRHNIYHFINGTRHDKAPIKEIDKDSLIYKKKLNVIGRTLKFGINLLTWGKCMFQKVDIKTEEELWELKNKLNEAFKNSSLPEKPDPKPFEDYLVKWRLYKMKKDGLI